MSTIPHTSAAGFYEKVSEAGICTIEPRNPTGHSAFGYEVYLENGFEPVGTSELAPYETNLSVRAQARYDDTEAVMIDDTLLCQAIRTDLNAAILRTVKTGEWFDSWVDTLRRNAAEEAADVEASDLSPDEKKRLIAEIQDKTEQEIDHLKVARELSCIVKGCDGTSGRFTIPGTFSSRRLFNQGTFKTLDIKQNLL